MNQPKLNLLDLPNKWIVEVAKRLLPENISLLASTCQTMHQILKESRGTFLKRLKCIKMFHGKNKEKNMLDNHHCIYHCIYFEDFKNEEDIREIVVRLIENRIFADHITTTGQCPVIPEIFELRPKGLICKKVFDLNLLPKYEMSNIYIGAVNPKDFEKLALQLLSRGKDVHLRIDDPTRQAGYAIDVTVPIANIASKLSSFEGSRFKLGESPIIFDAVRFKTIYRAPYVEFSFEDFCFYPNRCEITASFYPARGGAVVILFDDYNGKKGIVLMKFCSSVPEADDFVRRSLTGCGANDYNFEAWFPQELLTSVFG